MVGHKVVSPTGNRRRPEPTEAVRGATAGGNAAAGRRTGELLQGKDMSEVLTSIVRLFSSSIAVDAAGKQIISVRRQRPLPWMIRLSLDRTLGPEVLYVHRGVPSSSMSRSMRISSCGDIQCTSEKYHACRP